MFSGSFFVWVNGCPTQEINIQIGLKQGDPLTPFLYLLVTKGLSASINNAKVLNLSFGFRVGNSSMVACST